MTVSRRVLLTGALATLGAGAAGLALVDRRVLPGGGALDRALGRCDVDVPVGAPAGPVVSGSFTSALRRGPVGFVVGYPPGHSPGAKLPVCLVLHGFAADARAALDAGRYPAHLAAYVRDGGPPFALAAMDGGPGYWHPHPGDDPLGALLTEFLPLLGTRGLDTGRFAALGWSMGGYGALLCALTEPRRVVAAAASAPAFWRSYDEARRVNPGAFDSAAQFSAYDVLARAGQLGGTRLRIDCGASDPFAPAVRALRDRLADPAVVHLPAGCHDNAFWQHAAPAQLAMLGAALAG